MAIITILAALFAGTTPGGEPVASPPTAASVPRVKRYCITDRREGVPKRPKICRTRADWIARGFDPVVAIGGR